MNVSNIKPNNILITQLGSWRDCLLTVPLTVDVRRLWPNANVTWIVQAAVDSILADHSCIDQILTVERGWMMRPQMSRQIREKLREQKFDLVLDPLGLTKSAVIGWLSGARTRIGFRAPRAREIAPWLATHRLETRLRHRVDSNRELLSPWQAVERGGGEFSMPRFTSAQRSIDDYLHEYGLNDSESWFVIHPGAIWPTAQWPVDRFGIVARQLNESLGLQALVVWSNEEEYLLSQVVCENSGGAARIAPAWDIQETAELIRCSSFLLSGDSDLLHLASAIGTPTLSLHGQTWADEFGGYGSNHGAIQSPMPNLSRRVVRNGPNLAMQAIEVEEVVYAADRLLSRLQKTQSRAAA